VWVAKGGMPKNISKKEQLNRRSLHYAALRSR
jgi:hypothetical protein